MNKSTPDYANPGLNESGGKDLNYIVENSEFLKPGANSDVRAAPPTTSRLSRTRTDFPFCAK